MQKQAHSKLIYLNFIDSMAKKYHAQMFGNQRFIRSFNCLKKAMWQLALQTYIIRIVSNFPWMYYSSIFTARCNSRSPPRIRTSYMPDKVQSNICKDDILSHCCVISDYACRPKIKPPKVMKATSRKVQSNTGKRRYTCSLMSNFGLCMQTNNLPPELMKMACCPSTTSIQVYMWLPLWVSTTHITLS
jgi:hypothetical protein